MGFSAKEVQCLRNTIPLEMMGKERFDAGTLFEYMLERFQYCRKEWGMNELPSGEVAEWWKTLYQDYCLNCYLSRVVNLKLG